MDQPSWRLLLVNSFESSLADPAVSSKVEKYTVPHTDPCAALRGELGLRTTQASKMFAVGVYRSRTMAELPTYMEYERCVSNRMCSLQQLLTAAWAQVH